MDLDRELIEKLGQISIEIQTLIQQSKDKHLENYKENEGDALSSFRFLLDATMSYVSLQFREKIENITEKQSYQLTISLSVIQSHFIINDLILGGNIIEASTLTRKQLENLTRLHELEKTPLAKLLKKTPNVYNTFRKFAKKIYTDLSEVAHFGTPRVSALMGHSESSDGRVGPPLFPEYSQQSIETYKNHAAISTLFIDWIIIFAEKMYSEKHIYKEINDLLVSNLFFQAFASGVLIIKEDDNKHDSTDDKNTST